MKKKEIVIILFSCLFFAVACKKETTEEPTRLFRPVPNAALIADSNKILASWLKIKDAKSYILQVSRDDFRTIDVSMNLADTGMAVIKNLQWDKLYQVQIKAIAPDTVFNSKWSSLGAIKTQKFPTILTTPALSDITENAVNVKWTTDGAPVSSIKILKASDSSVVSTTLLTPADIAAQSRIIGGLAPSTGYIIFLYSGTTARGWADFTTKATYAGTVIDLRGITGRPSVLADTIPLIPAGSTVILKRNENYIIATLALSKAISIVSGSDLAVPGQAIISITGNFNVTSGAAIDSIMFNDVTLRGNDWGARYVFNINAASTIGKMSFISCKAEIFRGMVRLQSQPVIINNFMVDNCIIDSLKDYGLVNVDVITSRIDNITIKNSTIYKAEKIVVSKNNSTSVTIESCTVNESPLGGGVNHYVDYSTSTANNVSNGVTINNCLFGVGKSNAGVQTIKGIKINPASPLNGSNNYRTSDQVSLGSDVPSLKTHTRPVSELFQDPANGNFKIVDKEYPGRNSTGDPRWRIQ